MINKAILFGFFYCVSLFGAPSKNMQLEYELQNLQTELQMVFERMETQENLIGVLRQEIENTLSSAKGQSGSLSTKFLELDNATKALSKDILTLKDYFNTTGKEIDRLNKEVTNQGKTVKQLEIALKALVEAISPDKSPLAVNYQVKSGDSLEKIAKEHGTTPKALKELNQLKKDTIFVGQNLLLP